MILHVIKSRIYSGAENVVCQIIKGLSDKEEFIYMAPHGPIEDKLNQLVYMIIITASISLM